MNVSRRLIIGSVVVLVILIALTVFIRNLSNRQGGTSPAPTPVPLSERTQQRLEDNKLRESNLTSEDRKNLDSLKGRLPVSTPNFDMTYEPAINQYIISKKTPEADSAVQQYLGDNQVEEAFDNNPDLFAETDLPIVEYEYFIEKFSDEPENLPKESRIEKNRDKQSKDVQLFTDFLRTLVTFDLGEGIPGGGGDGEGFSSGMFPDPLPPISPGSNALKGYILKTCLKNKGVYQQASSATGVPWQVFGGIHYIEGSCQPDRSLISGRRIGTPEPDQNNRIYHSLLETAVAAGNILKGKIGGKVPGNYRELVEAASRYNGGGNHNCGNNVPYAGCPALFFGEDDPYPLNYFDDKHDPMYLIYCYDHGRCNPPVRFVRPGSITATRLIIGN